MSDQTQRLLNWTACFNARDVGGYPVDGPGHTRWGALVRADNLIRLTPAGCQSLVEYGVKTVIDLRSTREIGVDLNPFSDGAGSAYDVRYLNLPLIGEADEDSRAALAEAPSQAENYCVMMDRFSANVAGIIRAVASARPGGVLVHCHAGKDRTGVVVAALLELAGVPRPVIAQDYALSQARLRPLFDQLYPTLTKPLERQRALEWFQARPETILAVLDHLDRRHGGVAPYLKSANVTDDEIAHARERLREPGV